MVRIVRRGAVERRLFELAARLAKARGELAVIDEQLEHFDEMASEAKVDSLVRGTPSIYAEAQRHTDATRGARETLRIEIARMEAKQERLIARLTHELG